MSRFRYWFVAEPTNEIYRDLLQLAIRHRCQPYLIQRSLARTPSDGAQVPQGLEISREVVTSWPGTELLSADSAVMIRMSSDRRFLDWAQSVAQGLYDWVDPSSLEDLGFLRPDGSVWLGSIAHEREAFMDLADEEHSALLHECPALGGLLEPEQPDATFAYGNIFGRDDVAGVRRLCIGLDAGHAGCLLALATDLAGPFQLLYQSPELAFDGVEAFLDRFGDFLAEDSRHDLWIRAHGDDATLVLERHNLIYAYGPLEKFRVALLSLGLTEGKPPGIEFPHTHRYYREWDEGEREILTAMDWEITSLRNSDVQRPD